MNTDEKVAKELAQLHAAKRDAMLKNAETFLKEWEDASVKKIIEVWADQDAWQDIYAGVFNLNSPEAMDYFGGAWHDSQFPAMEMDIWIQAAENADSNPALVAEFRRIKVEGL